MKKRVLPFALAPLGVLVVLLALRLHNGKTIDQLQNILEMSFSIHGWLLSAYLLRKPFARPLYSVLLGTGLLLVLFLLIPYSYASPFPYHSGIQGRMISAATPALIIVAVFSLFSTSLRAEMGRKRVTPMG